MIIHPSLKYGVLMWPKKLEMIAVVESVWEQIQNHGISKNNHVSNIRAKIALKFLATTFLILTLDSFYQSVKSIKTLTKTEK